LDTHLVVSAGVSGVRALGTAQHAVAAIIHNPLSVLSYTGLVNVPFDIAGLALNSGIAAARDLGVNAFTLANILVTGVTAQVSNVLAAVNNLTDAAKGVSDIALVDGVLTAVQGIVSAPVTVSVAGVNGLTGALTGAGSTVWTRVTNGAAAAAVTTWLGDGTARGALQTAINTIGAAPLSPAAYTNALSVLVGAGVTTISTTIGTANSLASVPFSTAAKLSTTGADMIKSFNISLATTAAGIMQAAGLPSLVYNLPHVLAAGVNGAVSLAAFTTSAALNGIALSIDRGNTLTGAMPTQRVLTVNAASDSASLTADATSMKSITNIESAVDTSETETATTKTHTDETLSAAKPPEPKVNTPADDSAVAPAEELHEAPKTPVAERVQNQTRPSRVPRPRPTKPQPTPTPSPVPRRARTATTDRCPGKQRRRPSPPPPAQRRSWVTETSRRASPGTAQAARVARRRSRRRRRVPAAHIAPKL
jgi:hypothetical protein